MNQSGENGLARNNELRLLSLLLACLVAACAGPAPAPVEHRQTPQPAAAPAPAQQPATAGVQVHPLQNPAVKSLLQEAREAEVQGDYDRAVVSLERALRIQPRDPELLQYMAEMQLHKQDYQQAMSFAIRSYDTGSRVGEVCTRNWHVISVAREHTGDTSGAAEANRRAGECISAKPRGY
jgi:tetratricopeptide (TPR) repeat protein